MPEVNDAHAGAPAVDLDAELMSLYREMGTVRTVLNRKQALDGDERAQDAMLKRWEQQVLSVVERLRVSSRSPDPLQGIRDAKYLNPVCAEDGCQWLMLARSNTLIARLEADMQEQPLRLWDGIRHAIEILRAENP